LGIYIQIDVDSASLAPQQIAAFPPSSLSNSS
jgi:hypothetical protein